MVVPHCDPVPDSRSIIVVDDVEEMRLMVRIALSSGERWRVVGEAANGMEAIEASERERPDVVLLDLEMPWMSGAECLPQIRKVSPETAVVIWTVEPDGPRAKSAIDLGAVAVLDKGRTPATLLPDELDALLPLS
jgi:DNA-binding NarL/FixJ family response regulator